MFLKHIRQALSKKPASYYYLIALAPWICFYSLEYYTHDPWKMALLPQLINYALFLLFFTGFTIITNSLLPGLLLMIAYSLIAGILNYFVMSFRGNPVLPWDYYSINTALSVSDNYTYQLNSRFYCSTGLLMLTLLIGCLVARNYRGFRQQSHAAVCKGQFVRRSLQAIACWLVMLGIGISMMNPAVTSQVLTFTNLFTQWASYRDNGFTVSFIENLQYMKISKPKGYNRDSLAQELDAFLTEKGYSDSTRSKEDQSSKASESSDTNKQPSVFVIMDEAFSDLSVLYDFETNKDPIPYVHELQKDHSGYNITGNLFVSVCGGNTANTEFEFLTGNTMAYLPTGSVAYQQYIHDTLPSLASLLGAQSYTTTGIHPYGATGWNRDHVYPWMGFQNTIFKDNFGYSEILRKYTSDRSAFRKLEEVYTSNQVGNGNPLFAFEVTMQNHGGYTTLFEDCPNEIQLGDSIHPYAKYTAQYLTLINKTDEALKNFLKWVDEQSEPIIVVFFGDHQPTDYVAEPIFSLAGMKKDELNLKEAQNRYVVPYVIHANYQLQGAQEKDTEHVSPEAYNNNAMSVNYLGAQIARLAGLTPTPFQQFLQCMQQELPVITANVVIDKEGNYMTFAEAKEAYEAYLTLYEKLQYCYLFDHGADLNLFQ